jgi:hypothetical protein
MHVICVEKDPDVAEKLRGQRRTGWWLPTKRRAPRGGRRQLHRQVGVQPDRLVQAWGASQPAV